MKLCLLICVASMLAPAVPADSPSDPPTGASDAGTLWYNWGKHVDTKLKSNTEEIEKIWGDNKYYNAIAVANTANIKSNTDNIKSNKEIADVNTARIAEIINTIHIHNTVQENIKNIDRNKEIADANTDDIKSNKEIAVATTEEIKSLKEEIKSLKGLISDILISGRHQEQ